jgi:hypothetical protein
MLRGRERRELVRWQRSGHTGLADEGRRAESRFAARGATKETKDASHPTPRTSFPSSFSKRTLYDEKRLHLTVTLPFAGAATYLDLCIQSLDSPAHRREPCGRGVAEDAKQVIAVELE